MAEVNDRDIPVMPWESTSGFAPGSVNEGADALAASPELDEWLDEPTPPAFPDKPDEGDEADVVADLGGAPQDEADEGEADEGEEAEAGPRPRHEWSDEELDALVTVKAAGEEVQVTLREALDGYARQADYTRKTQEVAQQRKVVETHRQVLERQVSDYATRLEAISAAAGALPPEVQGKLAEAYREAKTAQNRLAQIAWAERAPAETAALKEAMGWEDDAQAEAGLREIAGYLQEYHGAEPAELQAVTDHRFLVIAAKAKAYDEAMEKAGEAVRRAPSRRKVLAPGAKAPVSRTRRKSAKAFREARERQQTSGSVDAARDALLALGIE